MPDPVQEAPQQAVDEMAPGDHLHRAWRAVLWLEMVHCEMLGSGDDTGGWCADAREGFVNILRYIGEDLEGADESFNGSHEG